MSQWERGEKHPQGPSLKLLTLVAKNGLSAVLAVSYWGAQARAILYPGTAAFDPEFVTANSYFLGLALQNYIEIFSLVLIGVAAWLALKPNAK